MFVYCLRVYFTVCTVLIECNFEQAEVKTQQ
jgi:hypothetical protein